MLRAKSKQTTDQTKNGIRPKPERDKNSFLCLHRAVFGKKQSDMINPLVRSLNSGLSTLEIYPRWFAAVNSNWAARHER